MSYMVISFFSNSVKFFYRIKNIVIKIFPIIFKENHKCLILLIIQGVMFELFSYPGWGTFFSNVNYMQKLYMQLTACKLG